MASFLKNGSIADLQEFVSTVYGVSEDQKFSLFELVDNQAIFAMRAIKGIRKNDVEKLRINLLFSFSWVMSIANRLHIDASDMLWKRFPGCCSYCGKRPCICKSKHVETRVKGLHSIGKKPRTLAASQAELDAIYPKSDRTLDQAGIHLAEETGEFSEAVNQYYSIHDEKHLAKLEIEFADLISCMFDVANSAGINIAEEIAKVYHNNCATCHKPSCVCPFMSASEFES
ncbi:MAG: MazG-like family protein [Candidatus Paceibacterota bacterium]|jgi:NTP pyrophosphatase (non-canonical NTP hydrolase)